MKAVVPHSEKAQLHADMHISMAAQQANDRIQYEESYTKAHTFPVPYGTSLVFLKQNAVYN